MSKPHRGPMGFYCSRCNYSVATGAVECMICREKQDWHPSYSRDAGCFWEIRHNCVMRKITEAEYWAGLKSEEEYYK